MEIAIVYDSSTGKTRQAAESMGKMMEAHGHTCHIQPVGQADPEAVAEADLICIGGWVKGLMIILQHPSEGSLQFIDKLGSLSGKKAVVFCTYLLAAGSTLRQMATALEEKGADVVGQFKYRGAEPDNAFATYAASLT